MDQCIPPVLQPLLQSLIQQSEQEMPGRMTAFYLEGSSAFDGFIPRLSDNDFIATIGSKATPGDFEKILTIPIALRGDPKQSYYHSRIKRAHDAFRFLKSAIKSCNNDLGAS